MSCDMLATSNDWRMIKPSVEFFTKFIEVSGHSVEEIAYVGDHLDNDNLPAAAGLFTVWIKRGSSGYIIYQPGSAQLELDILERLPSELENYQAP